MGFAVVRWAVFKTRCHENYPGWSGIPTVDDDNPQYSHRIHAAIYGNMDPINIPPMLAYIPAPWILWDIVEPPTIIWDLAATFLQGALCQRVWKKGTTLKWGMLPEVTRCFSNRFQEKHVTQILSWVFLPSHRSFIKLVEDFQESPSMNGEIARVSSPFKWCWYLHEKYLHEIPINQLIYIYIICLTQNVFIMFQNKTYGYQIIIHITWITWITWYMLNMNMNRVSCPFKNL